jgi:hypothetical protein
MRLAVSLPVRLVGRHMAERYAFSVPRAVALAELQFTCVRRLRNVSGL